MPGNLKMRLLIPRKLYYKEFNVSGWTVLCSPDKKQYNEWHILAAGDFLFCLKIFLGIY